MREKSFTVHRPLTGTSRIIKGKSLKDALKKFGLDPDRWVEVKPEPEPEVEPSG